MFSNRYRVGGYYAERGWSVDPGEVIHTSGTSAACAFLFKFLSEPGDEFLIP